MTAAVRFRDQFAKWLPPWLANRWTKPKPTTAPRDPVTAFSYLWSMIAPLDAAMQVIVEGAQASWPGAGTPTALSLIGRSRGITRGYSETDAHYQSRLIPWLDRARRLGSSEAIALAIHELMASGPTVRVYNRSGFCVTCDASGNLTTAQLAGGFDWDSLSNPERHVAGATYWSDIFVVVYIAPWATTGNIGSVGRKIGRTTGVPGAIGTGIGHFVTREEYDGIRSIVAYSKAAHTRVRCIIWSYDNTLQQFHPNGMGLLPNGTWGRWSWGMAGSNYAPTRHASCRYWEPN